MNEEKKKNVNKEFNDLSNPIPISITTPDKQNNYLNFKDDKGRKLTFANLSVFQKASSNNSLNLNAQIIDKNKPINNLFNLNVLNIEEINKDPSVQNSELESNEKNENKNNLNNIIEIPKLDKYHLNINYNTNNNIYSNSNCNYESSKEEEEFHQSLLSMSNNNLTNNNKLQEFYINDNNKNKIFKHKNNEINTTKYNIITFLPKSLLIQFSRLSNVYFLATAIIQSIPIISPLSSVTAIFPLIFVLGVSMIRDLIEDLSRLKYDSLNNNAEVIVFREKKFIKSISSSLRLGELIIVLENEQIPADMIIIDSNLNDGMAYVETSTLDGEKNLKPKISNNNLCGLFKNCLNYPDEKPCDSKKFYGMEIEGFCQCNPPNFILNRLDGKILIKYNIRNYSYNEIQFPISERQMLLKGSILKNTSWIVGIVIYTGMNNKIILNSKKPRTKMSVIEKKMNKYLIGIFILLIILCMTCSIIHAEKYNENKAYYEKFILLQRSHKLESFITFFTYFLLLNTLIPISLIITIEIVKIAQGFFISWDIEMYSKIRKKLAKAKTVSIIEELGNINYIFSDKTGTLTSNKMEFKYCVIQGKCYEYDKNIKKSKIQKDDSQNSKIKKYPIIKIPKQYFSTLIKNSDKIKHSNGTHNDKLKEENTEMKIINEFWIAISIAHECITTKIGKYSGVSPDDVELVKTAHEQGYTYIQSSNGIREIRIGNTIHSFTVLNVLNFSSERKRMSIIIKDKENVIKLYCKGADSEIMKRMSFNSKNNLYSNFTFKCVDKLSCKGYRSLMIAYKIINEDDYDKWNRELKNSEMNLAKKDTLVDKCYDEIERDLELIGATMVEDKLQDLVPETIKDLRMAGIKIWVLTGDKVDTAENIALGCNLISRNQKIFRIFVNHGDTERAKNNVNPEIEKFFKEYYAFENDNNNKNNHFISSKSNNNISNNNSNRISSNNKIKQQNSNHHIFKNNNNVSNNNIPNDGSVISFIPSINASNIISNKSLNNINNNNLSNISSSISCQCNLFPKRKNSTKILSPSLNQNNSNLPFSIIIEAPILSQIFKSNKKTNSFLKLALKASTVICCRVSPLQKSKVVQEVKKYDKNAITLAVGDGGNDVSMIMEAHLGIGIYGEEGMRAVQASDFAIGEFKFLRRLLFFHGRSNNNRISNMIIYFFYKNFVFTILQFVYSFFCIGSGQTIIDDWFITCYNLVFTALPVGVYAVTDLDLKESDGDIVKKFMPLLYKESREIYPIFSLSIFIKSLIKGFISSFLIFYIVCFCDLGSEINNRGHYGTLWWMSLKTYTNIIISVNMTLLLKMNNVTYLFPLIMGISSFMLYIIFLIMVQYMTMFNSCATIFDTLTCPKFYISSFLVSSMSFLTDYMIQSIYMNFGSSLSTNLLRTILNVNSRNDLLDEFVQTRKKFSDLFQINHLKKKSINRISFLNNNKNDKNDQFIDFNNTNDDTFKKSKSSQLRLNLNHSKDKIVEKNASETVLVENSKNRLENYIIEEDKKDNLFKPNEKWMTSSKIKIDNRKLDIPRFQLNT